MDGIDFLCNLHKTVLAEKMSEESRQLGFDTKAVRLGYKPDVSNNYSLMPPIGLSSTFQQDDPSTHRVSDPENTV